ncbi:hypothetical protein GCM10011346_52970 [Oceanobacillus neutriphilus]|uniref:Uncharacterized protein n=1 Tax=Oceanobacillus neutriphilus TaxID=531815 RepID=A0ABQ2P435_9BACI|nr:hypothetical protein GCM10011346_52970 [Oceanobacillus neutriphilus]
MNFSIFIRLWVASIFGKVKIKPKYKHLLYMTENKFILPIQTETWTDDEGFPHISHSHWYTITNEGKKAMWGKSELLHTKIVAWLAILISIASLTFTIYIHLTK